MFYASTVTFGPPCGNCAQPFDAHLEDGKCLFGPDHYYPAPFMVRDSTPIYGLDGKVKDFTMGSMIRWDGKTFKIT